jgi:alpha-tubulin suppressor-like RCC1 family protein
LRDSDGSVWPNSAEIGALLTSVAATGDAVHTLYLVPVAATSTVPVPTLFESSSSTAAASGAPEPFVTPAKNQLFSLEKRRTDSLFRLPEPSLLSEERPAATAAKAITAPPVAASTLPTTGDMLPPARKSGHPRDVFMLAFGGSVHRVTVPPSAQLPLVTLLRHTIVDSASAAFEYHSPSAAHTSGGAGTWAAVELPAAVAASSKGRVRLLDATDEHVFAMTADGLLYRWPMSLKGSFGGARALPRPVARESGGSDAMRFQSLSCGATMALAVTADGQVYRVGREVDGVPKVPSQQPGALDGADDADLVATWTDDADERAPSSGAGASVGSLLLAARVSLPTSIRVSKVACGEAHRLLLTTGGSVYAFGDGKFGRLGLGDERASGVARCVVSLASRRCVDIAVGAYHSAAVVDDGRLLTWGHGKYGQLGHGTQDNEFVPREVGAVGQHRIVRVVASTMFTAALTVNGDVYTCGFPMTPAEDASKYSGAMLSSSPRLALSGMHIVQLGASLAGGLFAVSGTIEGASDKNPVELN